MNRDTKHLVTGIAVGAAIGAVSLVMPRYWKRWMFSSLGWGCVWLVSVFMDGSAWTPEAQAAAPDQLTAPTSMRTHLLSIFVLSWVLGGIVWCTYKSVYYRRHGGVPRREESDVARHNRFAASQPAPQPLWSPPPQPQVIVYVPPTPEPVRTDFVETTGREQPRPAPKTPTSNLPVRFTPTVAAAAPVAPSAAPAAPRTALIVPTVIGARRARTVREHEGYDEVDRRRFAHLADS